MDRMAARTPALLVALPMTVALLSGCTSVETTHDDACAAVAAGFEEFASLTPEASISQRLEAIESLRAAAASIEAPDTLADDLAGLRVSIDDVVEALEAVAAGDVDAYEGTEMDEFTAAMIDVSESCLSGP